MLPERTIVLDEVVIVDVRPVRFDALEFLQQPFRDSVVLFIQDCKIRGIELRVFETYRTPERQDTLKMRGRSQLVGGQSKHQYGLAVDVVPIVDGKLCFTNKRLWRKIGKIGEARGLHWGGRWKNFVDFPHFETK